MSTLDEAGDQSQLSAALTAGIGTISQEQEITFTQYKRLVLPIDGFVFWVRADLTKPGAVPNTATPGTFGANDAPSITAGAAQITVSGSLHYSSTKSFEEVENYSINRVIFTSEAPIEPLNKVGPATLWIGTFNGLKFAFGAHALLYVQAGKWHYAGDAIYPDMQTQLVESMAGFSTRKIVSNSLPFWLSMNNWKQQPWQPFGNDIPLYPSYQLPANIQPPWGAVHIVPETTQAMASAPRFGHSTYSRWQLARETVRVTLFGARNNQALDFCDFVQQFAEGNNDFGIMNMPVLRDEKRTQTELSTLAQKKTVMFEVNYHQGRANALARQLITQALIDYEFPEP